MNKAMIALAVILISIAGSASVFAKDGGSGNGRSVRDDRVRVEIRTEDEADEDRLRVEVRGEGTSIGDALNLINSIDIPEDVNRFRFESRDDDDSVRIELRSENEVEEDELPDFEIEGNIFEITGMVSAFTGGTVTVDGRTITINPSLVTGFEQEGTIEVGEAIKVEGIVAADGVLLAREIKADGVEVEAGLSEVSMTTLLNQLIAFLKSLTS